MTKNQVLRRVREKLTKLHVYNETARKTFGTAIARDMFQEDLDFLTTLLALLEKDETHAE